MDYDLTLRNYRPFQKPATISMRNGLTGFIGTNNAGKSSLLRFFYECRDIFAQLWNVANILNAVKHEKLTDYLRGGYQNFTPAKSIYDYEEMFCDRNNNNIEFQIKWNDFPVGGNKSFPARIDFTILRRQPTWHAKLYVGDNEYNLESHGKIRIESARQIASLGNLVQINFDFFPSIFRALKDTMYIGAYRNILEVGGESLNQKEAFDYYDIQVGKAFVSNWRELKTGAKRSNYELAKRVAEDIRRIFDFETLEINPTDDARTLQVIINGRSYRLPELGSGIAQFIVVLANAAIKRPSYVLIDEPELTFIPRYKPISSLA